MNHRNVLGVLCVRLVLAGCNGEISAARERIDWSRCVGSVSDGPGHVEQP
jgi:hypothetical protein